jgi:hypothetical protein
MTPSLPLTRWRKQSANCGWPARAASLPPPSLSVPLPRFLRRPIVALTCGQPCRLCANAGLSRARTADQRYACTASSARPAESDTLVGPSSADHDKRVVSDPKLAHLALCWVWARAQPATLRHNVSFVGSELGGQRAPTRRVLRLGCEKIQPPRRRPRGHLLCWGLRSKAANDVSGKRECAVVRLRWGRPARAHCAALALEIKKRSALRLLREEVANGLRCTGSAAPRCCVGFAKAWPRVLRDVL